MSISRSGYYKWKYRKENPSLKEITRQSDLELIKKIHSKHKAHGYRWINRYIRNLYGVYYTDNYVHRLCKYENIRYQGKHYQWKKPEDEHKTFCNLVWNGWKKLKRPFEVIVSDMTSFWVKNIYYELTLYFDAWNKEIVGYGLSSRKGDIRSYYDGLNQVLSKIKEEQIEEPVILHTDQGSVYSSTTYNNLLNEFNVQRSMSRAGTPTDNPKMESINGWIKDEIMNDWNIDSYNSFDEFINAYIYYYNNERLACSLDYKTPIQYKAELGF